MNNDAELLRQFVRENSQAAFAELVRRHVDLVYSAALRKVGGDSHAARDVAQAVFVALAHRARALATRSTLVGWLYLTSHRQAAQWVRAERRRRFWEHKASTMNEIFNTTDIDWERLRPVLDDTLRELSEIERAAILLRYFEHQPFADMGRSLQISEDAARMRVDRALEKLRMRLARRGVSSTAAALAVVLGQQVTAAPADLSALIGEAVTAIPPCGGSIISMYTVPFVTGGLALIGIATAIFFSTTTQPSTEAASRPKPTVGTLTSPATEPSRSPAVASNAGVSREVARIQLKPASDQTLGAEREARDSGEVRRDEDDRRLAAYRPLLGKFRFSPAQRETFEALVVANLHRHSDLREFARTQGARPVDPDVKSLEIQADTDLSSQLRAIFPDAFCAAFEDFNDTGPMREMTHHLAEALAPTSDPLGSVEAEQLVEILARHSRGIDGRVSGDPQRLEIEEAIVDAQRILTPPQIAALRRLHDASR